MKNFNEVVKSAVTTASNAVLMMTGSVHMAIRWAEVIPTLSIASRIENPEAPSVAAYIDVTGDFPGHGLLLFEISDALVLCDLMLGRKTGERQQIDELENSALLELANIVGSSYVNAIADFLGCALHPNPPAFAYDMAAAIVQQTLCACANLQFETYSIATSFVYQQRSMNGLFLFIPDQEIAAMTERNEACA